jgi:probable addiction module antidote protein
MPKTTKSYRSWQLEKLTDPERAASYLNAALQDSPELFQSALAKVAQANQMSRVAKEAGVQRESLYRSLSEQGNPTLETLWGVLGAVGLRLAVTPITDKTDKLAAHTAAVGKPAPQH